MGWPARSTTALALVALASAPAAARAQNREPFYYSEDAALMAGAVTARPADNASLWYNPAGLAAVDRARVTASGSAFGLRIRSVPDAFVQRVAGGDVSLDLDSVDVVSAPHTLSASFHLAPGIALGLGLFVSERDVRKATVGVVGAAAPELGSATFSSRIDLQRDVTKYELGAGLGVRVAPGLRIGVAPLVTYATDAQTVQFAFAFDTPDGNVHQVGQASAEQTRVGLTAKLGLQADVDRFVHVGVAVRLPELRIHASQDGGVVVASATTVGDPSAASSIVPIEDSEVGAIVAPARVSAGVLLTPSKRVEIGVDLELTTRLTEPALDVARREVMNGAVGVRVATSESLVIGAGAFTDLSAERTLGASLGDEAVDWVGGTLGATLRTPIAMRDAGARPDALVLSTTLAARGAVGVGRARALVIDEVDRPTGRDVVYGEIMPFFGSSILF